MDLGQVARRIEGDLAERESVLVAFSGGVDSSLVAALAHRALGVRALAVTAVAETLAERELGAAREAAREIGIRHRLVVYSELANPEFVANPAHRCYVCQGMRMGRLVTLAAELGFVQVCDGTNASDPGPDRPGLRAVREEGVYSPLLRHGVGKEDVRRMARLLGLSSWNRPANACLSSRLPRGLPVTAARLRRVEAAEELLQDAGYREVRVRHDDRRARVEVAAPEVARLQQEWAGLFHRLLALGFVDAEVDPLGYRAGGADAGTT